MILMSVMRLITASGGRGVTVTPGLGARDTWI